MVVGEVCAHETLLKLMDMWHVDKWDSLQFSVFPLLPIDGMYHISTSACPCVSMCSVHICVCTYVILIIQDGHN